MKRAPIKSRLTLEFDSLNARSQRYKYLNQLHAYRVAFWLPLFNICIINLANTVGLNFYVSKLKTTKLRESKCL